MQEVKTKSGFKWSVDTDNVKDDMELVDDLAEVAKGNLGCLPGAIVRILGDEGKKALYEHCRGENGRVSAARIEDELQDIFADMKGDSKN